MEQCHAEVAAPAVPADHSQRHWTSHLQIQRDSADTLSLSLDGFWLSSVYLLCACVLLVTRAPNPTTAASTPLFQRRCRSNLSTTPPSALTRRR
ncbi:hypothetical protein BHE74_00045945 [Ensete ventricosum]|nr:hypothetical protein BHE74_00045945 [Ensete ventricosum]